MLFNIGSMQENGSKSLRKDAWGGGVPCPPCLGADGGGCKAKVVRGTGVLWEGGESEQETKETDV